MEFAVAIAAGGLYGILGRKLGGGLAHKLWFLRPAMLLICSASLANTIVGVWAARLAGGGLGWAGELLGMSAATAAGVVGLLLLVGTALDLKDHRPDGIAKTGLIVLPVLVMVATGPLAASGSGLFDSLAAGASTALASLIGG